MASRKQKTGARPPGTQPVLVRMDDWEVKKSSAVYMARHQWGARAWREKIASGERPNGAALLSAAEWQRILDETAPKKKK